jgi:hypothetical protein
MGREVQVKETSRAARRYPTTSGGPDGGSPCAYFSLMPFTLEGIR